MSEPATINEIKHALHALAPSGVSTAADAINDQELLVYPDEARHLDQAAPCRKNEFIAGRRCARAALESLGCAAVTLPPDADGIPLWPKGYLGSITHSRGLCCAVVADRREMACLGIDLEKTTRLSPAAMKRVLHSAEQAFAADNQSKGSLLFSAKEAFFKMQFPTWRAQPSFKDLALAVDESTGELSVLEIADHLPASLREAARHMRFRYRYFGDYVVTICWLMPDACVGV